MYVSRILTFIEPSQRVGQFSSTRRLPSRLFSSTRRLFGSPSPSPSPTHQPSSSVSSLPPRGTQHANGSGGPNATPPPQQRRLAEFATILGDLKLSVTVWEALRKEGKGGSVCISEFFPFSV